MPFPSLPPISLIRQSAKPGDVVVVGRTDSALVGVGDALERTYVKAFGMPLGELATQLGATAEAGRSRVLPAPAKAPRIVVVGLGATEPTPEDLRRAAGAGVRAALGLSGTGPLTIAVSLGASEPETVLAVCEGALLGTYRYLPGGPPADGHTVERLAVVAPGVPSDVLDRARAVAGAVAVAREWVNVPPNLLFPASFADEIRELAKDHRVAVEVLDEKALARGGYGGLLAVGGGSSRPPRLVRLSYAPRGANAHLALVGKGITFDSGGLNLKPGDGMYTMKSDMAGAAAVVAAVDAIAQLGLKVQVTGYACLAENLPSDTAYRPSDVLTIYGGTTVENGNTDAEGRLVLADGLVRAGEDKPDLIVDVATLTGACVVALGDRTAGLMASDDETADRVLDAAEAAGEDVWQLPIPKEIRPKLDSKVADLRSTSGDRGAGALVAAAFLREFVPDGVSWAHIDIAGPSFFDGPAYGYAVPGGTGFGVRTLVALGRSLAVRPRPAR